MADAVVEGAKKAGAEVSKLTSAEFGPADVAGFDGIAFGCPAMGAEVLEEDEFQPMWDDVKGKLGGKKVGLFGSYGWGGGEWMNSWADDARMSGVALAADPVMANEVPDDEAVAACEALGATLA
jgi:flavodoxin short chain